MNYQELADRIITKNDLDPLEALSLLHTPNSQLLTFLAAAEKIKWHFKGNKVKLCAIVNAKSGRCSENCNFCAQSSHHQTGVKTYPLLSAEEMTNAAKSAEKVMSATCFSIVTSGKTVHSEAEMAAIASSVQAMTNETNLNRCVSLGILNKEQIMQLKESGLKRLHHNLETAESFFSRMCTTHTYQDRIKTIKLAKEAGLEVCSGGIFGLGETLEQRIELAFALKELKVQSVPINILNPIPGTPAEKNHQPLTPFDTLKLVAAYRFILPTCDLGLFGGREQALGSLQPLMFLAGANVTLVGNYLTTNGQAPENDLRMIRDLELVVANN
ncbi:MAG: biotin synthase BioB [bacterium]